LPAHAGLPRGFAAPDLSGCALSEGSSVYRHAHMESSLAMVASAESSINSLE
jgi:hypothetical protein